MTDMQSHGLPAGTQPPGEQDLFAGGRRAAFYAERTGDEVAAVSSQLVPVAGVAPAEPVAITLPGSRGRTVDSALHPPAPRVVPVGPASATWGMRGRLVRASGGLLRIPAPAAELAHEENVRVIRQATWTRSVSVVVANPKGGVGKTPATILLAGALGWARGGYVAAWEGNEAAGSLTLRSEGQPRMGVYELAEQTERVDSAGVLGAFTAPQASHCDVIGAVGPRPVLTAADVAAVRRVLERYYRVTVVDTGDNPHSEAFGALIERVDALVVPTLLAPDSVVAALDLLDLVAASGPAGRELSARAVVAVMHDGRQETPGLGERLVRALDGQARTVVDIPYDRHIAAGGELSLASLTSRSHVAWTQLAADVVRVMHPAI